jgi:hypothetical protein
MGPGGCGERGGATDLVEHREHVVLVPAHQPRDLVGGPRPDGEAVHHPPAQGHDVVSPRRSRRRRPGRGRGGGGGSACGARHRRDAPAAATRRRARVAGGRRLARLQERPRAGLGLLGRPAGHLARAGGGHGRRVREDDAALLALALVRGADFLDLARDALGELALDAEIARDGRVEAQRRAGLAGGCRAEVEVVLR